MKKTRRIVTNIAFYTILAAATLSAFITMLFIEVYIAFHYPELWALLKADSWEPGKEMIVGLGIVLAITAATLVVDFITYCLLKSAANHLLQCDITRQALKYPVDYYIGNRGFTENDRRTSAQLCIDTHYRSYTVIIEFTFEEMTEILRHMELHDEQDYALPKSFLMPDSISWLRPIIPLYTARRVMKELEDGGAVLLKYWYKFPKRDRIKRTEAKMRIKANLHCPTYKSADVYIGFVD